MSPVEPDENDGEDGALRMMSLDYNFDKPEAEDQERDGLTRLD
jgi:hypothetical protein